MRRAFLFIVLAILGTGYLYLGSQLLSPLDLSWLPSLGAWLALFLPFACLLWLPLHYWRLDDPETDPHAHKILRVAHFCMGLLSLLLFFTVLRDLLSLTARVWGFISGSWQGGGLIGGSAAAAAGWYGGPSRLPLWLIDARGSALILGLALVTLAWGFRSARSEPAIREVTVPLPNLPPALDGLRIAQISDLHIGSTIQRDFVERVVEKTNALQPDLIALTGDITDGTVKHLTPHAEPLGRLKSRLGCFYVTGNHEHYWEAEAWTEHLRGLNIHPLSNSHRVIEHAGNHIVVAGISDHDSDLHAAIEGAPENAAFRLFLAHQPKIALKAASLGFDLQLSGHTHGGQFWPWTFVVRGFQPFVKGLHRVGRMWLYVNLGTGYWGPPLRLGTRSEITLLKLAPMQSNQVR